MNRLLTNFDVGLAAFPMNFLKGLRDIGVPVRKLVNGCHLRHFIIDDSNSYLPVHVIYDLYDVVKDKYGEEFFSPQYLLHFKMDKMGNCGKFIASAKCVLPALQYAVKYSHLFYTNQSNQLTINSNQVLFTSRFKGKAVFEKTIVQHIWLVMWIDLLNKAGGDSWKPKEIWLNGELNDYPGLKSICDVSRIKSNQGCMGILFDNQTLTKSIAWEEKAQITEEQLKSTMAWDLSDKINMLFDNLDSINLPSLCETAHFFGVSNSTLKRHLATENVNYHEILEQWRFTTGVNLLTETNLKIKDISNCLHYANAANFVRAFRRWSGKTPSEFRTTI